jgi:nucleoside 2-deoxyribosyltransferase
MTSGRVSVTCAVRSVYLASPLGFSETTRGYYVTLLGALTRAGFTPLDPWADAASVAAELTAAERLAGAERLAALRALNARLGAGNAEAISIADAVLAVLDGVDVDSGTAAEIGFAAALGKPVVGLRLDLRRTGDNDGSVVNLQVEHFLTGPVHRTLPAALDALARLA